MTTDAWSNLVRDFPEQFLHIRGPMECGDGWEPLIREVCHLVKTSGVKWDWVCIKEKFGGLRMYGGCEYDEEARPAALDEIHNAINLAGQKSFETCETCGQPGKMRGRKMRGRGWWYVACDEHNADTPPAEATP